MTAPPRGVRRAGVWLLLATVVVLLHLGMAGWVADRALELDSGNAAPGFARLKAVFVAELRPTAPPDAAPRRVAPSAPPRRAAAPAAPAASAAPAAASAADAPDPQASAAASAPATSAPAASPPATSAPTTLAAAEPPPDPPASAPSSPADRVQAAAVPASAASAAAAAVTVDWPRSTQLTYRLTGNYRGPVEGQASVQWLRDGDRYHVHLEVSVGPSFAPAVSRRMSSDGIIGPDGLSPRRYEEETRAAFRDTRRVQLQMDGPTVRLATGAEVPRPPGLQDSASQFVQLTWLFTTQPDLLRAGRSVDLMLALPRRVEPWTYDVRGTERLFTPAGAIDAVHVQPRRPARAGDLTAEMWTAPSLQYLPVRIVIRQDADTWVDLLLDRLPMQVAEPAPR